MYKINKPKAMKPHSTGLGLLCVLLLGGQGLAAQTLDLSPTAIGSLSHNYFGMGMGGDDYQAFTFGTPSVELQNYDTIIVSVIAPAGEAWNISYSGQGLGQATLSFSLDYNNSFSQPWAAVTSGSLQFDYITGSSGSVNNFYNNIYAMPDSGDRFDMSLSYDVVGDLSFTGFTASITYNNSTLAAAALTSFNDSTLDYQYQPSDFNAPDSGPLLTLQSVPEPSTVAFIVLGSVGAIVMLRRRP